MSEKNLEKLVREAELLRKEIEKANYYYYVQDMPIISDAEYDDLFKRLIQIELEYPELVTLDSPTQKVGGEPSPKFDTINFKIQMLSLGNAFNYNELKEFDQRVKKIAPICTYCTEVKLDGLAISLRYENGSLTYGSTRGDGYTGENVTANLKTIKTIPLKLVPPFPKLVEVRGEVVMFTQELEKLNMERQKHGLQQFANTRNAAAGSVRQLDPKITAIRKLVFFAYHIGDVSEEIATTQTILLGKLNKLGFKIVPEHKLAKDLDTCWKNISEIQEKRKDFSFGADGVVIKVDEIEYQRMLGQTTHEPRWALAYKFPPEEAETVVKDIIASVGRTGTITPLAIFNPIKLEGSTISRASLHNEDELNRLGILIGDHVIIHKAGSVIPEIVKVMIEKRVGNEHPFEMPEHCPVCGAETLRQKGEAYTKCTNASCPAQVKERILHFASRENADIDGLGNIIVSQLVDTGKIKSVADLYTLKQDQLMELPRMGMKLSTKIKKNIDNSKNVGLAKILAGLGILLVGKVAAQTLTHHFKNIDLLMNAKEDEMQVIDGIGPRIARSIKVFFSQPQNQELIEKLKQASVRLVGDENIKTKSLNGKTFVLTGTLPHIHRTEAEKLIEAAGGKISPSVSKLTDYVVVGNDPGSKLIKSKKLGIKTINEEEFLSLVNEA